METAKFGKREIMLVAWGLKKRCNQSFRESLVEAWDFFKRQSSAFSYQLRMSIKNKRVASLAKWDIKNHIMKMDDNTRSSINFTGWFWDTKYNVLFN